MPSREATLPAEPADSARVDNIGSQSKSPFVIPDQKKG